MRILFIGDIVGGPGRKVLENNLTCLEKAEKIDFTIANGENSSGGFGMNKKGYDSMSASGVDAFTLGNHAFDNKRVVDIIAAPNIARPYNYLTDTPGEGLRTFVIKGGLKLTLVNMLGRVFNPQELVSPFTAMDQILKEHSLAAEIILLDFHADATSEKICLGHYLDGRISALVGTHTHVQTADERILPRGTGFITDVGMTGAYHSCLGMDKEAAVLRLAKGENSRLFPARGEIQINAVVLEIDEEKHTTRSIKRIQHIYPGEF